MSLLKPRTATVPIYQGDDLERLADLHREAEIAERRAQEAARSPLRGGDEIPSAADERAAYDAFVDEAAERAVIVELTAIGKRKWRDLLAAHPARKHTVDGKEETVEDDAFYEVNAETFPQALLTFSRDGVSTVTGPRVPASEFREFLENEVSDGDFERLWSTAYWLNRAPGADPKDSKFSTTSPRLIEN